VIAKCITGGIIIGAIIFFGFIKLNKSVGNVFGFPSANTLAADNNFLRQQVSLISPRVSKLEMQALQLNERANTFRMLLHRRKSVVDTVSSLSPRSLWLIQMPIDLTLRNAANEKAL
jgi:hypothetical protein